MRFNSTTGEEADGINVFRHSNKDKIVEKETKFKSVIQLDQVKQIIHDTKNHDFYITKEKKSEFFKPAIVESNQIVNNDQKMLKILMNTQLIPRKPKWDPLIHQTAYDQLVFKSFNQWKLQLDEGMKDTASKLTQFEHNLNVWKQLWLVIEKSDIVGQIVDARNPYGYICPDIVEICQENNKSHVLILNKADLLSDDQKKSWKEYFDKKDINFIFWQNKNNASFTKFIILLEESLRNDLSDGIKLGFVGYPNVGKSSTINSLVNSKIVAESSTPGKTKTLQTVTIDEKNTVFDCPGLFIPKFFKDPADIALLGIYPPDELAESLSIVQRIVEKIPAYDLCKFLKINFFDLKHYDAESILDLFGKINRIMIGSQRIDRKKCCKLILKRYMDGSVLYCHPPPDYGLSDIEFNNYMTKEVKDSNKIDRLLNSMFETSRARHKTRERKIDFFKEMKKSKRNLR